MASPALFNMLFWLLPSLRRILLPLLRFICDVSSSSLPRRGILGLDTNHGYGKTAVENSEVAKRRTALEKRLANVQRWADAARKRSHNASKLYLKLCKLTKERATALYRELNAHQMELQRQDMESWLLRKTIKEEKAVAE